jgi:hypothetical protein
MANDDIFTNRILTTVQGGDPLSGARTEGSYEGILNQMAEEIMTNLTELETAIKAIVNGAATTHEALSEKLGDGEHHLSEAQFDWVKAAQAEDPSYATQLADHVSRIGTLESASGKNLTLLATPHDIDLNSVSKIGASEWRIIKNATVPIGGGQYVPNDAVLFGRLIAYRNFVNSGAITAYLRAYDQSKADSAQNISAGSQLEVLGVSMIGDAPGSGSYNAWINQDTLLLPLSGNFDNGVMIYSVFNYFHLVILGYYK